jgi:signal transduction histidine kinase
MNNLLEAKEVSFQSEARLLEELGERLVASAEVAIIELVKNSYDADASICSVELQEKNETLIIKDDGHGISSNEFLNKWMRIATGSKLEEENSKIYKRKLTGAKGIGRFSVRFLADFLTLESIAYDEKRKKKTKLIAEFDWRKYSKSQDIREIKIPYKLYEITDGKRTGTILILSQLHKTKEGFVFNKDVRTEILKIITPYRGLDAGRFAREEECDKKDPGFRVNFIGQKEGEEQYDTNLAKNVLDNYWLKLIIDLKGENLQCKIYTQDNKRPILKHEQKYKSHIKKGLKADIRFFPRRAGIFSNKGFKGHDAWKWIHAHSGVRIIDHSFIIKPYGFGEDDWLMISRDKGRNLRDWRSEIMRRNYEMQEPIKSNPAQNPMLYLPKVHQLVGAVFVESGLPNKLDSASNLIPAMDREGFLKNKAFDDLFDIVRTGIEMIALTDKKELERINAQKAREASIKAKDDIKEAINYIKDIPSLPKDDKNRIIARYTYLANNIKELDDYNRKARQGLETMSLLGVIAGFMTHESDKLVDNLRTTIETLQHLSLKHKELNIPLKQIEKSYQDLSGYRDYIYTFIKAVHGNAKASFKVLPQIRKILKIFDKFNNKLNIEIIEDIDESLITPTVPTTLYSGILINIYTNALKAIFAGPKDPKNPKILFKAWNEPEYHIIEISDNGIGIPPALEKRIWDPLFSTTSQLNNPLGSGMGLGLNLVKKLLKDIGGSIRLIKPPKGFSTCFRIEVPFLKEENKNE